MALVKSAKVTFQATNHCEYTHARTHTHTHTHTHGCYCRAMFPFPSYIKFFSLPILWFYTRRSRPKHSASMLYVTHILQTNDNDSRSTCVWLWPIYWRCGQKHSCQRRTWNLPACLPASVSSNGDLNGVFNRVIEPTTSRTQLAARHWRPFTYIAQPFIWRTPVLYNQLLLGLSVPVDDKACLRAA